MPLPSEVRAPLTQPSVKIQIGDVWWLPEEYARYPGGKGRFCLIVALETPPGSQMPARAHYVAGSTRSGGPQEIVLDVGEANLGQKTYFRFWWSGDIDVQSLVRLGRFKGRLAATRTNEIVPIIRASKRSVLKKLVG